MGRIPIQDQFTTLACRQRRWQLRRQKEGRCARCGKGLLGTRSKWLCVACLDRTNQKYQEKVRRSECKITT